MDSHEEAIATTGKTDGRLYALIAKAASLVLPVILVWGCTHSVTTGQAEAQRRHELQQVMRKGNSNVTEFRKLLIGHWRSAYSYKGTTNIVELTVQPNNTVTVVMENRGVKTRHTGSLVLSYNNRMVTMRVVQPDQKTLLLSKAHYGEHNGTMTTHPILRVDRKIRGVLKKN